MKKREYPKRRIVMESLFMAAILFFSGFLLGWAFDYFRTGHIEDIMRNTELGIENYVVEKEFLSSREEWDCQLSNEIMEEMSQDLRETGRLLETYGSKASGLSERDYDYLKRKYFTNELRFYNLFLSARRECDPGFVIVLFFYDPQQDESLAQGYVLDEIVRENTINGTMRVRVLSFDGTYEYEIVRMLRRAYNITRLPALVIDDSVVLEGYQNRATLSRIVSPIVDSHNHSGNKTNPEEKTGG